VLFVPVVVSLVGASGCLRAEAKSPGATPALAVPAPPSRTLVAVSAEPDPVPAPVNPSASTNPPPRPADPPAPTKPPPAATPPTTPPAAPVVEAPPPVLQTSSNAGVMEAKIKESLDETERELKGVNQAGLTREAKDHLNTAMSHVRAARQALVIKNFLFAQELAGKAATLARQLVK
jgi:hypothetical protein